MSEKDVPSAKEKADLESWEMDNVRACLVISGHVAPRFDRLIRDKSAAEAWDTVGKYHLTQARAQRFACRSRLETLCQGPSEAIEDYFECVACSGEANSKLQGYYSIWDRNPVCG